MSYIILSLPRMKSATQDIYWPDQLRSRTGASGATQLNGLEKIWVALFRLVNGNICLFSLANTDISVRLARPIHFGLFGLANILILVYSVWPIPLFRSVRSGQYQYFGLFGLSNTHISVYLDWPIPRFRSVRSGQYLISRPRGSAK